MQCERSVTETWKCANCFGFSDELYDELTTSAGNSLHWFCPKCEVCVADNMPVVVEKITDNLDKLAEKNCGIEHQLVENFQKIEHQLRDRISAMEQLIETKVGSALQQWQMIEDRLRKLEERPAAIEESQERIEFKVDQLKLNDPVVKVVQGALEGALQQDKAEEMEIEHRKQNVIVHGVPESNEESPEQRIEEDTTVLAAMFHEIGADAVSYTHLTLPTKRIV